MLEAQSGPHAGDYKASSKEKKQDFLLSISSFFAISMVIKRKITNKNNKNTQFPIHNPVLSGMDETDPAAIQMYNVLICAYLISCHAALVGSSMSLCGFSKWNNKRMSGETVHSSE